MNEKRIVLDRLKKIEDELFDLKMHAFYNSHYTEEQKYRELENALAKIIKMVEISYENKG